MRWLWVGFLSVAGWTACSGSSINEGGVGGAGQAGSDGGRSSAASGSNWIGGVLDGGGALGNGGAEDGAAPEGGAGGESATVCAELPGTGPEAGAGGEVSFLPTSTTDYAECWCDGSWATCTVPIDKFCVDGLPCPLTLSAVRRAVACPAAGAGEYGECDSGATEIQWGNIALLAFATSGGALAEAESSMPVQARLWQPGEDTSCSTLGAQLGAVSHSFPAGTCRACAFGTSSGLVVYNDIFGSSDHLATCVVDRYGNIALPAGISTGGTGGTGGGGAILGLGGEGQASGAGGAP